MNPKTKPKRIAELCRTYRSGPQIGLVLGAGVSCSSGVPLYLKMVLDLCQLALEQNLLPEAPPGAVAFLKEQAEFLRRGDEEKVAQLATYSGLKRQTELVGCTFYLYPRYKPRKYTASGSLQSWFEEGRLEELAEDLKVPMLANIAVDVAWVLE